MNILDEIAAKTRERTEAEKKKVSLETVRRMAEEKTAAEKAAGIFTAIEGPAAEAQGGVAGG